MNIERLKFRGRAIKEIDNFDGTKIRVGDWVFSEDCVEPQPDNPISRAIAIRSFFELIIGGSIDPATVGQWTGLKDRNGKEIFEGDRLHWENDVNGQSAELTIRWTEYNTCFQACDDVNRRYFLGLSGDIARNSFVISNVHNAPTSGEVK